MRKMLIFGAGLMALASCGSAPEPQKKAVSTAPAVRVNQIPAASSPWPVEREVVGTVQARTTSMIAAKLMAYVREIRVNTGDTFSAGQTLITLDSKDFDSAVRQAEAARREAQSTEAEMDSAITAAKAQLELAQVTFRRMKDLFDKKSISNQEFDEAQAKLRLAQASYDMTASRKSQLSAKLDSASEAIQSANILRAYTTITAPFAGVVTERKVEPGNLVTPGTPLLMIEQAGAYRLEVPVEESMLPKLKRGQPVRVSIEALDRTLDATIGEIVPAVDAASRAVTVKINLPPMSGLRTGMSGRAKFPGETGTAISVPVGAVRRQGSIETVFVVDQGVARSRLVTTGEVRGEQVRVLSGLNANEPVIHPVPAGLEDGARVEAKE
ncbi:MAG: efflux RND transporter periplasmic adaptor subunit [Bryobacterales bacterium]|nr:efflux RND transporter periplasmic adaptor subunit [Bryobacterales bacterium]